MLRYLLFLPVINLFFSCRPEEQPPQIGPPLFARDTVAILALGDSYTKGQGIDWTTNFPNQLKDSLMATNLTSEPTEPLVIAQTGWRTDQLLAAYQNQADVQTRTFDLVTLCIGVNNQFQKRDPEEYRIELEELLQEAIERAGNRPERVLVISIPDWGFTPFGQNYPGFGGPSGITAEIDQWNEMKRNTALQAGTSYVFVTDLSRKGLEQPDWVAADGLHPSALQYSAWLSQRILPVVRQLLRP